MTSSDLDSTTFRKEYDHAESMVKQRYIERSISPFSKRRPISKHLYIQDGIKFLIMDLEETEARNNCAGQDK
jgi:hypothetical protein